MYFLENFWDFSTRDDVTFTMSSLARQAPAVAARPRLFRRTSRPAAVVRAAPAADAEQTRPHNRRRERGITLLRELQMGLDHLQGERAR